MQPDFGDVLLTGASGFVGSHVRPALANRGWSVRASAPKDGSQAANRLDLTRDEGWGDVVTGCRAVVHLAARAHVLREDQANPLAAFRSVNTEGTRRVAAAAVNAGVKHFVFVSSLGVHGKWGGHQFTEADAPSPDSPYAVSKLEAEQVLKVIARESGMAVTILRPPLVYGPRVGGRFRQMIDWLEKGIPLPLKSVRNSRSLIGICNFADAICHVLDQPAQGVRTFLVSDDSDISTPDLLTAVGGAIGRSPRLVPMPEAIFRMTVGMIGKGAELDKLIGTLTLDPGAFMRETRWRPPYCIADGLAELGEWYRQAR
jgi:nucleoside-diphosphate-sugar epimerase